VTSRSNKQPVITETRLLNCKFDYACPQKWDSLEIIEKEDVFTKRYCNVCKSNVMFVTTHEELEHAIESDLCVAVPNHRYKAYWKKKRDDYYQEISSSAVTVGVLVPRKSKK